MSLVKSDLSVLAYSNGFTLWHYKNADAITTITASGYFNDAANLLKEGDVIMLNSSIAGTLATNVISVASVTDGVVSTGTVA